MERSFNFFQQAFDAAPVGMLVVDASGTIVDANRQLERLFGYAREELLGKPVEMLVDGSPEAHRGHRSRFFGNPETRPMGAGRDLHGRHKDGRRVPVEIGLTPLRTANEACVLASVVDLTERKQTQERLEASLSEKEILLKELHHRAKNNLQLIASLLDLASSSPGPDVLAECRSRINSIALVHERLYQSGTLASIELSDYLKALSEQVSLSWSRPEDAQVTTRIDAADVNLSLELAIPVGLIVNELITNAFKHAFPGRGGTVTVTVRADGKRIDVSVRDDGVGIPVPAPPRTGHIGLDLVQALTRQLRADLAFERGDPGTCVRFRFGVSP